MHLLKDIARALLVALGVFAVLRTYDLVHRGVIAEVFRPSYESGMFALEFALGVLLPFVLLLSPRTRTDIRRLYPAALLAVSGFLVNRLNVSVTGLERSSGTDYVPAFSEIAISLFLVALGFGAFGLMVRYFRVYPEAAARSAAAPRAPAKPSRALAPSAGRPA